MILYVDTSALVKLYVAERDSGAVRASLALASVAATSRVAYAEARAAFARRQREGAFSRASLRRVVADLDRDWPAYVIVEVTAALCRSAGDLAEQHALRGFDALHLASALELGDLTGTLPAFLAHDERLSQAATALGLTPAAAK
ncbi:MAG: type II toxin-antitoxin system VapC family toxin [Deltaproteobacteria bacterium]|nr:type II toxin-antitoxin system VapC family toxin [Deltaproteobacteria bacterium]